MKINTQDEIQQMRAIGAKAAEQMTALMESGIVQPGVTTNEIDQWCFDYTMAQQCSPACLGYRGYPKTVCISPNNIVCHGIPDDKQLKKKDILNIDITIKNQDGWHGDTSTMFIMPKATPASRHIAEIAREAMYAGIKAVKPGACFNEIGKATGEVLEQNHAKSFRQFVGHGINQQFHDAPHILTYNDPVTPQAQAKMEPGMIFTVEPICTMGDCNNIKTLGDGWTVVALDKRHNAQWEHTVLVTETGYEILTWRDDDLIDREG